MYTTDPAELDQDLRSDYYQTVKEIEEIRAERIKIKDSGNPDVSGELERLKRREALRERILMEIKQKHIQRKLKEMPRLRESLPGSDRYLDDRESKLRSELSEIERELAK